MSDSTAQWIDTIRAIKPPILSCPQFFDGPLADFHSRYVLPNLPEPSIVEYYHGLLSEYCFSNEPIFIVRKVPRTERWRISEPAHQKVYVTRYGYRFKAADNAPSWWMYQVLAGGLRIPRSRFSEVLHEMPMHMHDVGMRLSPSTNISAKGWHLAHLGDVKDGDTSYEGWNGQNLIRRFIRNLHPCNFFYMPKLRPQVYGGGLVEKAFYHEVLSTRYATIWQEFTKLASLATAPHGGALEQITFDKGLGEPGYSLTGIGDDSSSARSLPFQAQVCLRIMSVAGKSQYTKSELIDEFAKYKDEFRSVQEPWRIFCYYKRRLLKTGLIREDPSDRLGLAALPETLERDSKESFQ